MTGIPSEAQMVTLFLNNNSSANSQSFIYRKEVSFYRKRIDLVQIRKDTKDRLRDFHAIEFKVSNWGRCLYQAQCNQLFFPFNSVAIWKNYIHRVDQNRLDHLGIGLIKIDYNENKILLKPKRSRIIDRFLYSKLRKKILTSDFSAVREGKVCVRNAQSLLLASK